MYYVVEFKGREHGVMVLARDREEAQEEAIDALEVMGEVHDCIVAIRKAQAVEMI